MVGKYIVITLCGSTRFKDEFIAVQKKLSLEGNIVVSVGLFGHSGDEEVSRPGVKEMLEKLKNSEKKIILATSKPEIFAKKILELFDISKYFDFIGGAATDKTRDKKSEVLEYSIKSVGVSDKSKVILVGDRVYDSEGAIACGIDSLGVLYGHGSEEEVRSAGFTYIVNNVEDIANLLI